MMKTFLSMIAAVILLASPVFAQTTTTVTFTQPAPVVSPTVPLAVSTAPSLPLWTKPGPYAMIQLGAYGPSEDDKTYDVYNPQAGFASNLVLGYRFSPFISLQGEIGYQSSEGEFSLFNYDALPLMLTFKLGVPVNDFEFYALAGFGAIFYSVEQSTTTVDDVAMATKFGVGLTYHINEHYFVGGDMAYQMTNVAYAPNDGLISYINVGYCY